MSWTPEVLDTIKRLGNVKHTMNNLFTARGQAVDLLELAAVCHEHLLLVGPPGTAKTEIINRFTELIEARGFHYLLTRFTEPSELFGPLDLAEFQKGNYTIRTERMLPEAQIAFLDEVFQGSSAILNSLLTLLNERIFFNGAVRQPVPLLCMIGASNTVPEDPWLRAFADRFVLRLEVEPVEDDQIDNLLSQGWELERDRIEAGAKAAKGQLTGKRLPGVKIADVISLHSRLLEVDISGVRSEYNSLIRELRAEGIELSDRRVVKGMKLVAGAALLRKAESASLSDLWPLMHIWTRPEESDVIKNIVQPRLAEAGALESRLLRPVSDIMSDLETYEAQESTIMSDTALGAHLMTLNKLRRELINDHPKDSDPRKRVETAIGRGLKRMESTL